MGYVTYPNQLTSSRAEFAVKANAWATIRKHLGEIKLQPGWVQDYHDRSVTYRHPKRGRMVKITLDGQVFVDQKKANGEYKSEVFAFGDIGFASVKAKELLLNS